MGLAPLDAWVRTLAGGAGWKTLRPRYWVRLAAGLCTSAIGTAVTLPERLLLAPILRHRYAASGQRLERPVVFVLGYYRSGTTHLHYLLSCDPGMVTPRWFQCLAPQGFLLSWAFLRWFLVPFLASTRPQDDVAIGPEWPAEDDFAVCNWSAACTMPGRMVLPRCWEHYRRYHDLEALTPSERRSFQFTLWAFAWKLGVLTRRHRTLLLKTPAHTARVRALSRLFPRAKFIHLSRDPAPVLRSNVSMHGRFGPYLLQDPVGEPEIRARIVEEYALTERTALAQLAELAPASVARMRFQDLIADPIGELRRIYSELGIDWTPAFETRVTAYLHTVSGYKTAAEKPVGTPAITPELAPPPFPLPPELAWMREAFGHDRPTVPRVALPPLARGTARRSGAWEGMLSGVQVAGVCAAAWLVIAFCTHDRQDWLIWPVGVAIGLTVLRSAGRGSARLGLGAVVLGAMVLAGVVIPATWITDYRDRSPVPWDHVWLSTKAGVLASNNLFWNLLGLASAYRLASRRDARPPTG